ncbi:MAG: heavy-metal-associated domain-containing protein [Patescibacteria group bacterium]
MPIITKKALNIEGMHCNSCASGIQLVLQNTDGVLNATASYDSKKGEVEFDEEKTNLENIVKSIEQLGYKATPQ